MKTNNQGLPIVGRFEKVSFEEFKRSIETIKEPVNRTSVELPVEDLFKSRIEYVLENIYDIYNKIQLPSRATSGSAGYDIYLPYDIGILPNLTYLLPTGIKVYIEPGWMFKLYPRSSWSKTDTRLTNTVGLVDSDYYNNSGNEGHIFISVTSTDGLHHFKTTAFCQGCFEMFGVAENDDGSFKTREGGFGSTTK